MSSHRFRESWRDALRAVDRRPSANWRDRLAHHAFRVVVVLAIAGLLPVAFPRLPLPDTVSLEEGMVAPEDVIAVIEVPLPKSAEQLAAERSEAERGVYPVYTLDPAAADSAAGEVRRFFAALDSALAAAAEPDTAVVRTFLQERRIQPTEEQVAWLATAAGRRGLRAGLQAALTTLLPEGVASIIDLGDHAAGFLLVRGPDRDRLVPRDSLTTIGDFYQQAARFAPGEAPAAGLELFQSLLARFTVTSLRPDEAATAAQRSRARAAVDTTAGVILEGERIVSAHERVGRRDIERLRAYNQALVERGLVGGGGWLAGAGSVLYGIVLLAVLAAVLYFYRPSIYRDVRGYLIVMGLVTLVLAAASIVGRGGHPPELIPIAFLALLLGALYDGLIAVVAVMVTAALIGGQMAFVGLSVPLMLTAAGVAAALGVRGLRRRSHSWMLIAGITGAYVLAGVAAVLVLSQPAAELLGTFFWGGVNATLCTVLAVGAVVPAAEKLTGITTDQTLRELSDLNAPLLRELSRKAPGTYAHSINVANLSEAACEAIGANALLARAGVYYHDIGKMVQPQYFVENQPKGRNPHDRLRAARSASIIRDHVREGLRLAAEHRLPEAIRDFIREHHGTTQISFFLDRAREEEPELELNPADFAYPGPKPQSRETAIVMLADGIESATRVLQDPTPDRIRATIEQIASARIEQNQLDQCPLTLRDLDRAKAEFARLLIGMYHRRIEYPSGVRERDPVLEAEARAAAAGQEEPASAGGRLAAVEEPSAAATDEAIEETVRAAAADAPPPDGSATAGPDGPEPHER